MRILMGIQQLWRGGGTETHVLTLSRQMKNFGHQVTLYTAGGEWVTKARTLGLRVQVDPHVVKSLDRMRQMRLRQFILQNRFDVLHAHDGRSLNDFASAITGLRQRPKLIFTVHGPYVGKHVLVTAQNQARAIIAVSSEIGRSLPATVNRKKVSIVPNGINTNLFHPGPSSTLHRRYGNKPHSFVIGYCSRFTFDKVRLGKRVVQALKDYAEKYPHVEVLIAGRGSKHAVGTSAHVHVLGHVEDMNAFYRACDVILCTGRTAAEALLCDVPVISIGKAGYHGIVRETNFRRMLQTNFGDHGPFAPWSPDAIKRDLRSIQTSRHHFQRQSAMVRRTALSQLSAAHMASRVLQIYLS